MGGFQTNALPREGQLIALLVVVIAHLICDFIGVFRDGIGWSAGRSVVFDCGSGLCRAATTKREGQH